MSACVQLPLLSPGSDGKRKRTIMTASTAAVQIVNGKMVRVEGSETAKKRRKKSETPEYVESDAEDEEEEEEEEEPVASTSNSRVEKAPRKPPNRKSRYACTWKGCTKTYTKPVRLAEHMRSHTGERPFECTHEGCTASYLRETHLAAHIRTHKTEDEKPLKCDEEDCDKRFWTNQHLKRHVKLVHEKDKGAYQCDQCDESFNKHHKLRSHVAEDHMPHGTKPFICTHEGCDMSFSTGSKLRTHQKVHDENRYICMHPSHSDEESGAPRFANWSALQDHNKTVHPPSCHHAECKGKVFQSNKKLKKHLMRRHLEGFPEYESEETGGQTEGETELEETAGRPETAQIGQKRKKKDTSRLIPTEPAGAYADFDGGEEDYEQEAEETTQDNAKLLEELMKTLKTKKKGT